MVKSVEYSSFIKKWKSKTKIFVRKDVETVMALLYSIYVLCYWTIEK